MEYGVLKKIMRMELCQTQDSGNTVKIFLGSMVLKYLSWLTICDKPYIVVKCNDDERIMVIIKIKQYLTIIKSFCMPETILFCIYYLKNYV